MKKVALIAILVAGCTLQFSLGQLFVSDQSQNEIEKFNVPGPGTIFVPNGQSYSTNQPTGLTFGPDGNLYVVGTGQGFVARYDGTTGAPLPSMPPPPMSPPNAMFTTGFGFSNAQGVTFGADGNIYVTNSNNVSQFNGTTGAFIQNFTLFSSNPQNSNPFFAGITRGPGGYLYVSDLNGSPFDDYHDSVLRLDVTNMANPFSTFVPGLTDGMQAPTGVTFGADGNLYVASGTTPAIGGEVRRFSGANGAFIDAFVSPVPTQNGNLFQPQGLVFGPDGNLYVSSFFHSPPTLNDPGVNSFVARYNGTTGAFIDYFGQGTTMDGFFGVAFPTLAAVPEVGSVAIALLVSGLLIVHFRQRRACCWREGH